VNPKDRWVLAAIASDSPKRICATAALELNPVLNKHRF